MTIEELRRWKRGELPAAEVLAVARHVSACADCRDLAQADLDLGKATDAIRQGLESPAPVNPRAIRWRLAIAAAILLALFATLFLLRRAPERLPPPRTPDVVETPQPAAPVPTPAVSRYARGEWARLVDDTRAGRPLVAPAILSTIRPAADVLRGDDPSPSARMKPAGAVLESQRPRLTWQGVAEARYNVAIFADGEAVARAEGLRAPAWTPPRPLDRGRTYNWEVEVLRDGHEPQLLPTPPAPPVLFHILDAADASALADARAAHPDDSLLLGILYARAGMDAEADAELRKVTNRHDAKTARRLRDDLAAWRR